MSYNPQIYVPNVEKSVFKITDSTVNSSIVADDRIRIDSSGFSHGNITVNSSGQFVIAGGEHVLCCGIVGTKNPTSTIEETICEFQFYDVTNSAYLGVAGRRVLNKGSSSVSNYRAPLCIAYINSVITVELRCKAQSGSSVNAWNSLGRDYVGQSWGYIYSPL